ncbi:MAG TPA: protein-L-isoaspartate(D-aspartate) O-methyltransferase [Candidatus Limnocylindrales bacterium]|nr:protein-L-isoaspartate(D-aspartate) O-methyltransferase [Candidatus Limnocylindrales bacterium]
MVNDRFAMLRHRMVAEQIQARGIRDERILAAMEEIPRHRFVPPHLADRAYDDAPLPIGEGQTISQPYIVAQMTHALRLTGMEKVLEVGTGSGYQTSLLCRLAGEVVTIERFAVLYAAAEELLRELGMENVRFRVGDGTVGVPEEAPFDRILVTAAAPDVPDPLFEQLADGGILVIPLGGRWEQDLVRVRKKAGAAKKEFLGGCRFVPLIGQCGFAD